MSSRSASAKRQSGRAQAGRASTGSARPMSPTMRFALVYVLALVVSLAVWFFYRSVYEDDTSFLVPIVISLVTSYVCAHALTGGKSPRNLSLIHIWSLACWVFAMFRFYDRRGF